MKITVHGIGRTGSALAYTLMLKGLCEELCLVSRNADKARGECYDLRHATCFNARPTRITHGNLDASANSDLIALCASVPTPTDMSDRSILARGNGTLFRKLIPELARRSPDAVLVIVSNPVDALTHLSIELSGFPWQRVIGAGTLVDSLRFRGLLSDEVGIHPHDLRAYILGEHGRAQFPAFASAEAGGEPIEHNAKRDAMFDEARDSAFAVFRSKGHTSYAIASAAAYIIEAIAHNSRRVVPVSLRVNGFHGIDDVCLSLPAVLGRTGIQRILHPTLNPQEVAQLRAAADAIRDTLHDCAGHSP
ncbi:MAG: lactate/malate dehydrogenase family protein [Planctomycetota bacterium]